MRPLLSLTPKGRAGDFLLTGPMTLDSAEASLKSGLGIIAAAYTPLTFDLSGVTRCDSAGVALLVEWQRQAIRCHCELRYVALPAALRSIMQVTGVDGLLSLSDGAS